MIPPLRRVPAGASDEATVAMYREAVADLIRFNPRHFLPPGARRRWYHRIIGGIEYPAVLANRELGSPKPSTVSGESAT